MSIQPPWKRTVKRNILSESGFGLLRRLPMIFVDYVLYIILLFKHDSKWCLYENRKVCKYNMCFPSPPVRVQRKAFISAMHVRLCIRHNMHSALQRYPGYWLIKRGAAISILNTLVRLVYTCFMLYLSLPSLTRTSSSPTYFPCVFYANDYIIGASTWVNVLPHDHGLSQHQKTWMT